MFLFTKSSRSGAPQVVFSLSTNGIKLGRKVKEDIDKLGSKGYRCIGVAYGGKKGTNRHNNSNKRGNQWEMTGLIPLFDPPREDTADTIKKANNLGISVKMITGDQVCLVECNYSPLKTSIAKETARMLEINTNILPADVLADNGKYAAAQYGVELETVIEQVCYLISCT